MNPMRMEKIRFGVLVATIGVAALTRLIPHPPNVTPITAIAVFGGAYFRPRLWAFALPLSAMILSDLFLGIHRLMPVVYAAFMINVGLGFWASTRRSFLSLTGAALTGSVIFFLLTNFGVWWLTPLYPKTWPGLSMCFTAAVPFFRNSLLGDLGYTWAMLGFFSLADHLLSAPGKESARI